MRHRRSAVAAAVARFAARFAVAASAVTATAATASAQRVGAAVPSASPPDSMVVTTAWLAAHLGDPKVVQIEVTMDDKPTDGRIPGARQLPYSAFVTRRDGLSTEFPAVDSLRVRFEALGISSDTRVVVYAMHGPMATRVLMSLEFIGHRKFSYLDGGLTKWKAEGRALTRDAPAITRGSLTPRPQPGILASAEWITDRLGKPGLALIDTRTDGEYLGTGNRSGMPSAGHLAGARQLEWESLFERDEVTLKDRAELRRLFADRVRPGDTVVTYCWVGYRASATYFAARMLGYDTKLYDGSYQDWQIRTLPTTAGATP